MAQNGEPFPRDRFQSVEYNSEHRRIFGSSMLAASFVLTIVPLLCRLVKTKTFVLSPQVLAMFIGIIMVIIIRIFPGITVPSVFITPYNVLSIYYTLMIVKFVYPLDAYVFLKSLTHILIVSVIGWLVFALCFSFLLITFAGELQGVTITNLCLVGIVFTPIEVPTVINKIEQIKLVENVMSSESVLATIFSVISLNLVIGGMDGLFVYWYQPVLVLARLILIAAALGTCAGLVAGVLIPRYCTGCVSTMMLIITSNFLLYHIAQFALCCSGGLCCFLYVILISRKRLELPMRIDQEIVELIDILYYIVSIVVSFTVVLETLPHFLNSFNVMATAVSLALYICANACRLVFFVSISPLLSRLGYGFTFKTLVMMVWCVKKGPMTFIMLAIVVAEGYDEIVTKPVLLLGLNYLFLMNALNEISALTVVRKLVATGDDLLLTSINIRNAFKHLEKIRHNQLITMRMQRFYADANWTCIHENTLITPQIDDAVKGFRNDGMDFEKKPPFCDSCKKEVAYKPSRREHHDMLTAIRLRVLQMAKMFFLRQFKDGFLDIAALRTLNHCVDLAMESKDNVIKIDPVLHIMRERQFSIYIDKMRTSLYLGERATEKSTYKPRYPTLNHIINTISFHIIFDLIAVCQVAVTIVSLCVSSLSTPLELVYLFILLLFYLEMTLKIIGSESVAKHDGYKRYIWDKWNKLEFVLIVLGSIDFIFTQISSRTNRYWLAGSQMTITIITNCIRVFRCTRLVRIISLIRFIPKVQMFIMVQYDKRIDDKLHHAYSVGRGIVACYENIDEVLHTLSDVPNIVSLVREQLQDDRNKISRELGLIEMVRPAGIMTLKTRQAMMCINVTMRNAVSKLRLEGLIDIHEYSKLEDAVLERWQSILDMKTVMCSSPRSIFYEVPWIGEDLSLFEFLYENVKMRVWDAGQIIYREGDVAEEIYILVTGMFKVQYYAPKGALIDLEEDGLLPVKDMIRHPVFDYPLEEFIFQGNSVGELSVMTGRPYCCDIIAEIPTQAFILPTRALAEALVLNPDPVNGLYSRIWKHISHNFVKRLLKDVSTYFIVEGEHLDAALSRSFVPRMDAYNIFCTNDNIESIVLIEGIATDAVSKEKFIAPCIIPRGSPLLEMRDNVHHNPFDSKPKLWIVPIAGAIPYEVMKNSEEISTMEDNAPSECLLLKHKTFKKWMTYHRYKQLSSTSVSSRYSSSEKELSINAMLTKSTEAMKSSSRRRIVTNMSDIGDLDDKQAEEWTFRTSETSKENRSESEHSEASNSLV